MKKTTLIPQLPYNFPLTLDLLTRFTYPTTDIAGEDGAYWRVLRSDDGALSLWRVTPDFAAHLVTGTADAAWAQQQLAFILSLDVSSAAFYAYAQTQPELWRVIEPLQGIRWLRTPTMFDALIALIIEQHISWIAAQKSQLALVRWGGQHIIHEGRTYYTYPTPEQLANATLDELTEVKVTNKRKTLMIDLAQQIARGNLNIEALRQLPPREVYHALMKLKGIGHWTAANVITRALGVYLDVTDTDVALQAAANWYFNGLVGKISPAQTRDLFARYGEFAPNAAYYTLLRWVLDKYPAISTK